MIRGSSSLALLAPTIVCASACVSPSEPALTGMTTTTGPVLTTIATSDSDATQTETDTNTTNDSSHSTDLDAGWDTDAQDPCNDADCVFLDVLIVVDNSATMAEEQLALGPGLSALLDGIAQLDGSPDVNIMVTSTDLGYPICAVDLPAGYEPLAGAPQEQACLDRLDDFTARGMQPTVYEEACTIGCPAAVLPIDPFVHFFGDLEDGGVVTNVPGNAVEAALGCLVPQGINGCGYEAPLEAMLRALDPSASWNQGSRPFLRDDAALAIVIVTDEADCSIRSPEGDAHFLDVDTFWELDPETQTKTEPTSAVCWNAGVDCGQPDMDGVYPDCTSIDTGVLHPFARYRDYLVDELMGGQSKEVMMLGIVGVPPVTAHAPAPPYSPTAGGVHDLLFREWIDAPHPSGDLLPGDTDAAAKRFELGPVGPGCAGVDELGEVVTQAQPPVRLREVCESLDEDDRVRCILESVCDGDTVPAFNGLVGMLHVAFGGG